jgi:integrase
MGAAVEAGAIKANPCDGVRIARSEPQEMHFLTMDELLRLANAMKRPEYGLLVRFAGLTGLRAGEIGALRVGRLDLLRRRVEVLETVSEVTGYGLVYGPPKTYERRSVPVPPALADELGALLLGRGHDKEAFVFTARDGGPLRHNNFMTRHFKPALEPAGLPVTFRFHDLRHTCAALLINADPPAHPLAVMKRLGHSSITVTYNTYGHLFPALDEALTASVDRAYREALLGGRCPDER